MKIILNAYWESSPPPEFKHEAQDSKGERYTYTDMPVITIENDKLTLGNMVVRLDNPRAFAKALGAMYL